MAVQAKGVQRLRGSIILIWTNTSKKCFLQHNKNILQRIYSFYNNKEIILLHH